MSVATHREDTSMEWRDAFRSAAFANLQSEQSESIWSRCMKSAMIFPRPRQIIRFLLPSFLHQNSRSTDTTSNSQRPNQDTEYLDGLRGCAAVSVVLYHFFIGLYKSCRFGYGFEDNWNFFQLPYIRILYAGHSMVRVFFVVSGFAISAKSIQLIRKRSTSLFETLSSTTFRRAMRLFLPSAASAFLTYLAILFGVTKIKLPAPYVHSFVGDTREYIRCLQQLMDIWTLGRVKIPLNVQLWTIPMEFRCSMVVFLILLGLARCRFGIRLLVETAIGIHSIHHDRSDLLPFIVGMVLAELHFHRKADSSQLPLREKSTTSEKLWSQHSAWSILSKTLSFAIFVLALLMLSFPWNNGCEAMGYTWICNAMDWKTSNETNTWMATYSAILTVACISFNSTFQRPFTTHLAQYFAKISFSLYLTHGLIQRLFQAPVLNFLWSIIGRETDLQLHAGKVLGLMILLPMCVWTADVFWRAVDVPSVSIARWLEKRCTYKDQDNY